MNHSTKTFAFGASAGAAIAIASNLLPYWLTYGAYATDGYQVMGFPFVFRRLGGIAGTNEFHMKLLILNLMIAISFAAIAGWFTVSLSRKLSRGGRGFPVMPPQDRGR